MDFVPLRGEPERVRTRGAADVDDSSGKIRQDACDDLLRPFELQAKRADPEPDSSGKPA